MLYRLSRVHSGPNAGDWLTVVQYADWPAYEQARKDQARKDLAQDPEYRQTITEIANIATRISRELVDDIDL